MPRADFGELRSMNSGPEQVEVSEPKEVSWWVFQWGAEAEVLEPESLREALRQTAKAMAVLYGRGVGQQATA